MPTTSPLFVIDDNDEGLAVGCVAPTKHEPDALNDTLSTTTTEASDEDDPQQQLLLPTADELATILESLQNEEVVSIQLAILQQLTQWTKIATTTQKNDSVLFLHEMNEAMLPAASVISRESVPSST